MCNPHGSIDQSIASCPMCKVFKPSGARCPHVRDVCRNRNLHPRHDVVYLKNAEVKSFNGCGYCKWAKTNPPTHLSGHQNPGWPGCCRAPSVGEQRYVQAADWPAVSVVYAVPIPPEIKNILDNLSRASANPAGGGRAGSLPLMDRRNSSNTNLSKPILPATKTSPVLIPSKGRSGGSPRLGQSILGKADSRGGVPSSLPSASVMDQYQSQRRSTEHAEKSRSPSSRNSPSRKHAELEGSLSRRGSSARRPSVSAATTSMSVSKVTVDAQMDPQSPPLPPTLGRRASVSTVNTKSSPPSCRTVDRQTSTSSARPPSKRSGLEGSMAALNISSASSSSGSESGESSLGSMTDSTVTSDGGFTDYLSDESEAELQRQAEAKAAIMAQNQAEEQEFKAARQQLAHIDLRPPKSWNTLPNNTRPQGGPINAYPGGSFSAPFMAAQTGAQTGD